MLWNAEQYNYRTVPVHPASQAVINFYRSTMISKGVNEFDPEEVSRRFNV